MTDPQTRAAAGEGEVPAAARHQPRVWTVDLPTMQLLNANQRGHWGERSFITRTLRQAAYLKTLQQHIPALSRAHIVCEVRFGDHRRRDPANWAPSAKAAVDGLVDAGVLPDDSAAYLDGPDMRLGPAERWALSGPKVRGFGRLLLHIQEVT